MKALFCGLGGIGQRHLRILKTLVPDISVGAIRKKARSFEIDDNLEPDYEVDLVKKYDLTTFSSLEEGLEFKPDFAIVSNPTSLHIKTTTGLIKNKVPVLMEKPVSDNELGLTELVELSAEMKTPIMVGYMMRFNPFAGKLYEYLEKEVLGRIYSVIVIVNSYMPSWHQYESYSEFYAGMKSLGGGVVLTEIHEIDLLNWFFGPPESISAVGGKLSRLNIDVEDTVSVLMSQRRNNKIFSISINMSFVQKAPDRQFIIFGENGKIEWNISENWLKLADYEHDNHENCQFPHFERNDMFKNQMKHFLDCLGSGKTPITSLESVMSGHITALNIKKALDL